jgi:hypothetical protein
MNAIKVAISCPHRVFVLGKLTEVFHDDRVKRPVNYTRLSDDNALYGLNIIPDRVSYLTFEYT